MDYASVIRAMADFDRDGRQGFIYWRVWAIQDAGRKYPPKEILRRATGVTTVPGGGERIINRLFRRLGFPVVQIPERQQISGQPDVLTDLEKHKPEYKNENATTKKAIISARLGQGRFRDALLDRWQRCCAVTGCQEEKVLRASHIKPWRDCTNDERLDVNNGLLLAPNLDALFDAGLISFDDQGHILISSGLTREDQACLGLGRSMRLKEVFQDTLEYLREHRSRHGYRI